MKGKKTTMLIMTAALALSMSTPGLGNYAFAMNEEKFSDVDKDAEIFPYVSYVVDSGIMQGESDSEFGVEEAITRSEIVSYLYKLLKSPVVSGGVSFSDVADSDIEDAVVWAESVGLFDGLQEGFFKDSKFEADTEISVEDAMVVMYNFAVNCLKVDMAEETAANLEDYADGTDVSEGYVDAVSWALGSGVSVADEDNNIGAADIFNKADMAIALAKLADIATENEIEVAEVSSDNAEQDVQDTQQNQNTDNQNTKPQTPAAQHTHNWVANMVTTTIPEVGHTENVLVSEAWTETIEHPAETHTEDKWVVDKEAVYETVNHPAETHTEQKWVVDKEAVYETVNHPAETHIEKELVTAAWDEQVLVSPEVSHIEKVWVETKPAYDEQILVSPEVSHIEKVWVETKPAYDEPVYETQIRVICFGCQLDITNFSEEQLQEHLLNHLNNDGTLPGWGDKEIQVQVGTIHHEAVYKEEQVWVVDKEAVYDTIHHAAEGYYEDKKVVDQEAVYETIHHDAVYKDVIVVDKEAWTEQVLVSPEEGHYETITVTDKEAWTEQVLVSPEEGHKETVTITDKEAWTETVEHEAVYKEEWVVDKAAYETQTQDGYICTGCGRVSGGIVGKG